MGKPAPQSARPTRLDTRRREQAAFMLPVLGLALLLPPLISLFDSGRFMGIPLETAYVFLVWLLLIAGAAFVSWRMPRADNPPPDASPAATPDTDG